LSPSSPPALVRIDQPAGDQRWPVACVADRADQPVVLVAEVGGERGDVAEHGPLVAWLTRRGDASTALSWRGAAVSAINPVHLPGIATDGRGSNCGPNDRRTCRCVAPTSHTPAHKRPLASQLHRGRQHIPRSDAPP